MFSNRKLTSLSVVVLLLVVSLVMVTVAQAEEPEQITIELWDMQQSDANILAAQEAAQALFELANPNIKINVTVFPYPEYRDKLLIAVQGGKAPDISTLDQIWTSEFAAAGAIIPLDDYIADSTVVKEELFFPGAWGSCLYQDKVWGVPLNNDVWEELYYNKDLFEAAGLDPEKPPATWDELMEMGKKLNNPPDTYGLAVIGGKGEFTTCSINSFTNSNGGEILNAAGEVVYNSPEVVAALEAYKALEEIAPEGTVNRDEAEAVNLFTSGKVAMVGLGSWQQDTVVARAPDMNWGVALMPAPEGKTFHGCLGGWSLSVYEQSENPDAAWAYVEFLSNAQVQKAICSLIPARLDAGSAFIEEKRRSPEVIFETVNTGMPRPISPVYPRISDVQMDMMQSIWTGTAVDEAVAAAATGIEEVVSEMP